MAGRKRDVSEPVAIDRMTDSPKGGGGCLLMLLTFGLWGLLRRAPTADTKRK